MKITLVVTEDLRIEFPLTYWLLFPRYEKHQYPNGVTYRNGAIYRSFRWLCVDVIWFKKTPTVNTEWSDEEVVRQMKNLEKEVEFGKPKPKPKPKPSVKRK